MPFLELAATMILEITYGYTAENVDDPFIHLADEAAFKSLRHGAQGATICDVIPICEEPSSSFSSAVRDSIVTRK